MRSPALWRLSLAEWRAHPWRQLAALLSVALGVALALSVHLINQSALAEFSSAVRSVNGEPDLSLVAGAAGMDEALLDLLAAQPEVQVAHPRIALDTVLLRGQDRPLALRVLGVDALSVLAVAPDLLARPVADAGRFEALDPALVFVNPALRAELAGAPSLSVLAQGRPLDWRVGGQVMASGGPLLVADIAAVQAQFGWAGKLSQLDLRLLPGASAVALRERLRTRLPAGVRWQQPDDGEQQVSNLSRAYRVNLTVLALVALVVGGFLVYSVVSLAVAQRTPALALLGVLGLSAAGRRRLVLGECALTGILAGLLGVALGTGMAAVALRLLAGDLGGGYFTGAAPPLRFSWAAAALCAGLGLVAAVLGGAWPAARAARLAPAQALKGLGGQDAQAPPVWPGVLLLAVGGGLALLPAIGGLPLAAYASVAAWLVGGIALVPTVVRVLLGQRGQQPARRPLLLLALQRARFFRATATAAVAGIVASLALCVALTVMVASFRLAVTQWLEVVLPADVYVRSVGGGQVFFPAGLPAAVARLPGVVRASTGRSVELSLAAGQPEVWLLARVLGEHPEAVLPLTSPALALPAGEVGVFVSEAVLALQAVMPGQQLQLPIGPGGQLVTVRVRGVWRDYARQSGSIAMDLGDYQRLSADTRLNELALWLAPDVAGALVQQGVLDAMRDAGGVPQTLQLSSTAQLKSQSLRIFDRSFAVTRYLQAVAIAIGLAGVAASLSAQVLARQREFGLLAHLGLTRAQVMRLVMLETAGWLAAGLIVGLLLGLAISAVLVWVVNPQSFHWTMDLHVPLGPVAALLGAVLLAGLGTSALTARRALSANAVRAVKEDW
jgi:putative ABC transport system permease protein